MLQHRWTAESGRSVGGVVNVITKSGANLFKGSAFATYRDQSLMRKDFFQKRGATKPTFERYEYGGSAGGAFKRDRLFYFVAAERFEEPGGQTPLRSEAIFQQLSAIPGASPVRAIPTPYSDTLLTVKVDHRVRANQSMFYRFAFQGRVMMAPFILFVLFIAATFAGPIPTALSQTRPAEVSQRKEVVTQILPHGNQDISDDEVVSIAGIPLGATVSETLLADATRRLEASGKFQSVDVVKRYASIDDPSRVAIVIIVSEGPLMPPTTDAVPQVRRRRAVGRILFSPVLELSDTRRFSFGGRLTVPGFLGRRTQLSVPMTGGEVRHLGLEVDRTLTRGPFTEVGVTLARQRWRNPAFDEHDHRRLLRARGQRTMGPVRAGVAAGWQQVSFADIETSFRTISGDITVDTRLTPALPQNAVFVQSSIERVMFRSGPAITRMRTDARGFVGLVGDQTLVLRGIWEATTGPIPPYLRSLLGGDHTLRGYRPGFRTGDGLLAASIEWRIPLATRLPFGRLGVGAFSDWGLVWDHGQSVASAPVFSGIGGTLWLATSPLRMNLAVAHGRRAGLRVHASGGIGF